MALVVLRILKTCVGFFFGWVVVGGLCSGPSEFISLLRVLICGLIQVLFLSLVVIILNFSVVIFLLIPLD